jgi:predicted nucleic acid-binding protein
MASPLIIIDTDILIDYSHGNEQAKSGLIELESKYRLAISVVTQLELMVGCNNKKEFTSLRKFLSDFQIIQITDIASQKAVELFENYRLTHGVLIPDMLIAATALTLDVTLCSKNKKDFQFIEGLKFKAFKV